MVSENIGTGEAVSYTIVRSSWWYKLIHSNDLKIIIVIILILVVAYIIYRKTKRRKEASLNPATEEKPVNENLEGSEKIIWRKLND